jgi:threonine dehydrogenase-like Zn-dependent dehydrogenase
MKPKTYKAAIYKDIKDVQIEELPYPKCGDNDVIVKNVIAGICGGDLAAWNMGGDANFIWKNSEFGHEMTSEVVEIGKDVKGVAIGDYVFPNMANAKRDFMRVATVGGFSEYVQIVDFEEGWSAIAIDRDLPLTTSVLLEPFVIGTRGVKNTNPGPGKSAIVLGAGIIGMSSAVMLKWYGVEKVMVVDISDYRLGNARDLGFITCNPQEEDLLQKAIAEFGPGERFNGECCAADIYIDALAHEIGIDYFMQLAQREAVLAVVGVHHKPVTLDFISVCYNNLHINGCGNGTYEETAPDVLDMFRSGKFDLSHLVSHQFRQDDIVEALNMANNSKEAQKVVIVY